MVLDFIRDDNIQGLVKYYNDWVKASKARQGKTNLTKKDIRYAHKQAKEELDGLHGDIVAAGAVKVAVALNQIYSSKHGVVKPGHIETEYDWCSKGQGKVGFWGRRTGQKDFSGLLQKAAKKIGAPKGWAEKNLKKIRGDDADEKETFDGSALHTEEVPPTDVFVASKDATQVTQVTQLSLHTEEVSSTDAFAPSKDSMQVTQVTHQPNARLLAQAEQNHIMRLLRESLFNMIVREDYGDNFDLFDDAIKKGDIQPDKTLCNYGQNILQTILSIGDTHLLKHYVAQYLTDPALVEKALKHKDSFRETAVDYVEKKGFLSSMLTECGFSITNEGIVIPENKEKLEGEWPLEGIRGRAASAASEIIPQDDEAKLAQADLENSKTSTEDPDFAGFDGVCDGILALSKAVAAGLPNLQAIGGRKVSFASSDGSFTTAVGDSVGDSDGAASSGDEGARSSFDKMFPTGAAGALHELSSDVQPPAAPKPGRKKFLKKSDAQPSFDSVSGDELPDCTKVIGDEGTIWDSNV